MSASDDAPDETRDALDPPTADRRDHASTHSRDPEAGPDPDRTVASASRPVVEPDVCANAIPGYVILSELGQGGMGVVYRARQSALNREVAIKTLLRGGASRAALARFWGEAEAMAAVRHPNVVQIFEMGDHAGCPFMAMELVTGGSLSDRLGGPRMSPRAAAELVEKVARGVAAAHDLGIVHRDLKPGNVLLAADGTPKVADFGLAKWHATDLTRTQTLMGTPSYMAPEQAAGRAKFLGPPADVWALGVILYECLSGARPFNGTTAEVLLTRIQVAEPDPLRVRGLARDLDTIVAKCLAKEPERRYPTATELADDLARYLRGEPIAARPVGRAERLVRWARRKPAAAAAYGFSALAVALALVVFVVAGLWREAEGAKGVAEGAKSDADSARGRVEGLLGTEKGLRADLQTANGNLQNANGNLGTANAHLQTALGGERVAKQQSERANDKLARFNYGQMIGAAYQSWRDNTLAEARTLLARTRPDLRGWEYDYVHRLCHADAVTFSHADLGDRLGDRIPLVLAAWNPDESRVLTSDDFFTRVWSASTGTMLLEFPDRAKQVCAAAWNPDGTKVVLAGRDKRAEVRDAATGTLLATMRGHPGDITAVSWSADGARVLTLSGTLLGDKTARVWDAATGDLISDLKGHTRPVFTAAFGPDGTKVLTASDDGTARVWDATTGKVVAELKGHGSRVYSAAWAPDGSKAVTAGADRTARVWDAATGKQLAEFRGHTGVVTSAVFDRDGSKVLTASHDATARLWDAASGNVLAELTGHTQRLVSASFGPDGSLALTASTDKTARVWAAATGKLLNELKGHGGELVCAAWSRDGSKVLTASTDKTARVWDAVRAAPFTELAGRPGEALGSASWSPDGSKLVTTSLRSPAQIWDATTAGKTAELKLTGARYAVWSRDGSKVLTASTTESPYSWDPATGARLVRFAGEKDAAEACAWSADGSKVLATATHGNPIIWNAHAGNVLVQLAREKEQRGAARGAAFSPDETKVLAFTLGDARVWDATTGEQLLVLKGHTQPVRAAVWSPDGTKVVTGSADDTARVWDAATGKQLLVLKGHTLGVGHALWSADGTKIVTAGSDGSPRIWGAATGVLLVELRGHTAGISSVSWAANESRVLTSSTDQTLRIWDAESGAELLALPAAHGVLFPPFAHLSPDGTRILTRGATGRSAVVYDARPLNRAFVPRPVAPPPRPVAKGL